MDNIMETAHLRYFVAVVDHQSFSKAAAFCHTSVSNLSEQIQTLEKRVRQTLLDRNRRRIMPTEAGRLLLPYARQILGGLDEAKQIMRALNDTSDGKVSVGVLPSIASCFLAHILNSFVEEHPKIQVLVHQDVTQQMLSLIETGKLDMGIAILPIRDNGFGTETLYSEEMLLALHPHHTLTRKQTIFGDDLLSEKLILSKEGTCRGGCSVRLCKRLHISPQIVFQSGQLDTIQSLVAAGKGISIIPETAITDTPANITYRQMENPKLKRSIVIVTRKKRPFKPAASKFYHHLLQASQTFKPPVSRCSRPKMSPEAVKAGTA
jgi:LysR family hydrogen peroxide-inducible transcriptional activator